MMTNELPPADQSGAQPDDGQLRRRALYRSWFYSGGGFALLGHRGAAVATFLSVISLLPAMILVAIEPRVATAWLLLLVAVAAIALSLAEQFACKWAKVRPPGPALLVSNLYLIGTVFWTAIVGFLIVFWLGFGSFQLAGKGMAPTFQVGDRLLYAKRVDPGRLQRGVVIVSWLPERSAWGERGMTLVSRILAVPGDRLAIRETNYIVNGQLGPPVAGTKPYAPVIDVPNEPAELTVPDGQYFIVQDTPTSGYDSRTLSWVQKKDVLGNRLFHLTGRAFLHPVE